MENKLSKYSKLLHWLTFLCLCLPFFYAGCKEKVAEVTEEEIQTDTTYVKEENKDTLVIDSIDINKSEKSIIEQNSQLEEKEKKSSEILSNEYTFLSPILVSKENTFSGLAMIIDTTDYIVIFSLFIFFILSILSLITKYLDTTAIKTIVLIDLIALLFLIISRPADLFYHRLWGFWLTIILFAVVTLIDLFILTKNHAKKSKTITI